MTWFPNNKGPSWIRRLCTSIVKSGPVPRHVAFIMDGNRRFAVKNSIDRAEGHLRGFDKLAETLEWCRNLGITEVTVYAFSTENFKRSKDEVQCLMELARQKFARLLEEKDMLDKHGIRVRIIGDLSLLPVDIQLLVAQVIHLTSHNTQATLNVCFAYTSQQEICEAMKLCSAGVAQGIIKQSDITEELLEDCLYTGSSHPDLLVRTSGEVRLSDFLLLQSSFSILSFVRVLWPDFSIWHLYAAVLHYQSHYDDVQKHRNAIQQERLVKIVESDAEQCELENADKNPTQLTTADYTKQRLARGKRFMELVREKQAEYVHKLGVAQTCIQVDS